MNTWICSGLGATFLVASAFAAGSDFSTLTRGITEQQKALDRALVGMGVRNPSAQNGVSPGAAGRQDAPLFRVHSEMKTLQAPVGRFLFGKVIQKLVIASEGSPVVVELAQGQGPLSGLRVLGTARQSSTGDRISMEFSKLLFRGGSTGSIQAVALDSSGALGVPAYVLSQKAISVLGAMASSFVSGVAASQQTLVPNAFGFQATQPTGRNAVLQGLSQTAADQSKRLIDEATAEKPVLILEPNTEISLLVQEEVRF